MNAKQVDQTLLVPKPTGANERGRVAMSSEEVDEFLNGPRTMTVSTVGPNGAIHSVAMWYGFFDGQVHMDAKSKSQKVLNLRRDPKITLLAHGGYMYDELHGVMVQGIATVTEDDDILRRIVQSIFTRYHGVEEPDADLVTRAIRNRVAISVEPVKIASWDHRKLGR